MVRYVGRAKQVPYLDFELELVFVVIEEFSVQTNEVVEKCLIGEIGLGLEPEAGVDDPHDLIAVVEIGAVLLSEVLLEGGGEVGLLGPEHG